MSSSWKDTSDFASLSAALAQMKKKVEKVEKVEAIAEAIDKEENVSETLEKVETVETAVESETAKESGTTLPDTIIPDTTLPDNTLPDTTLPNTTLPDTDSFDKDFKLHCTLPGHKSVVSCLCFERSGSRLLTGSHDSTVAYWDFAGMTLDSPAPFRFIQPLGSNPIHSICASPDSQWFLFCAGTAAAKLFDRNGAQVREYAKGDPYLRDLRHTIGHVAALTGACWNAGDEDRFFTASEDGCLRQWHIGYRAASEAVLPIRSKTPQRCLVSAVACLASGWLLVAGADGLLRLFPLRTFSKAAPPPVNPTAEFQMKGRISSIAVFGQKFAARSVDGQVCVFEVEASALQLMQEFNDQSLASSFEEVSLCFTDRDTIFTGCKRGLAQLNLLSSQVTLIPLPDEVASVAWNAPTGQLAAGLAPGRISIFCSQRTGRGGARLMSASSKATANKIFGEADISAGDLYAPRASSKRKADKVRADPLATHRPELPVYGQGQGGRLGSNVTQQIMRQVLKDTTRDADPREALLKYADQAAKNPKWVSTAYAQTQPEPIFDVALLEKEAKEEEERKRRHEEMERLQQERKKREKF